jgi:hypothetical protein
MQGVIGKLVGLVCLIGRLVGSWGSPLYLF